MDTPQQKLRINWAKSFPETSNEWPYWWIEGEGYCLAIIDGGNLAAAVEIVEDNWERYASIKAYLAKRIDEDLFRRGKGNCEICNREYSKQKLNSYREEAN